MEETTCGVVMGPFLRALRDRTDLPPTQIIGGNGSNALLNNHTVIDLAGRTIEAPADCDLPRFRPDNSLRDMDTLVLSTEQEQINSVQTVAEQTIGDGLKISVFGLKTIADLNRQAAQPLRSTANIFLGDRYITTSYDGQGQVTSIDGFKALYPFHASITMETLETFQLCTQAAITMPTTHPGATILNYLTRSISGVRAKDLNKVETMAENVLTRYPEVREWIHDGPGQTTLDLARILHTLREPRENPQVLQIGSQLQIVPYTLDKLHEHPGFMATGLSQRTQRVLIEMAYLKSHVVGTFEGNPAFVTFWQKHIEDRLRTIIHNDP